ncbi:MAG: hypothetical protein HY686_02420 [Chloroflexi bacterium]|nr:hypothetical protein [Chloroflexota bacterium]
MTTEHERLLQQYVANVHHYLANALSFLARREPEKASEFLWGSVAEALKAVAWHRGVRLRTHREVRGYAKDLAKQFQDSSLFDAYQKAESFHSNFYESRLTAEDISLNLDEIRGAIGKLLALLPEQFRPPALR